MTRIYATISFSLISDECAWGPNNTGKRKLPFPVAASVKTNINLCKFKTMCEENLLCEEVITAEQSKNLTSTHIYLVVLLSIFIHFFKTSFHSALTSLLIHNFFNSKS